MSASDRNASTKSGSRTLIITVAVIAALLIAVLFYFLMRATGGGTVAPSLEGAVRPGAPDFEKFLATIVLDEPEATEARRPLGDIVMTLQTTVRNFSGKTLSGLEIKGAVVDHQGQPVKQRTVIVIPSPVPGGPSELAANKTVVARVVLDGMTETDDRANIKMEITGFRFKN